MKYYYFVSYSHRNGIAFAGMSSSERIKSIEQLMVFKNKIECDLGVFDVIIINYKLLRKEE